MNSTETHSQIKDQILGFFAGVLLTVMIALNGKLSFETNPTFASLIIHGIGTLAALLMIYFYPRKQSKIEPPRPVWWTYLAGVLGASALILIVICLNGPLGITGTIAFALLGEVFGIFVVDHFGLFGQEKKPIILKDVIYAGIVTAGALVLIYD